MPQPSSSPLLVRFASFEADLEHCELRKGGLRLRVQEQPFVVLAALLNRPGEVVTREELVTKLWPGGTYVDFDRGLNAAVARLRQVLQDSAESPRYIETVARRGYRFIAPVEALSPAEAPGSELPATAPEALPALPPQVSAKSKIRWVVILGIALLTAAAVTWGLVNRQTSERVLEQITRGPGLSTDPALSPDGKLMAYASDRGGDTLNIWVTQLVPGGSTIQLTRNSRDSHQPSFSPDGSKIVYRSEQDGGAVYVVPTIGGEPELLAREGRDPRFSPDGKWVAYWVGSVIGSVPEADAAGAVFIVPATGGHARHVGHAQLPLGGYPIWSSDSKRLLVYANPRGGASAATADWWVVPIDGGPPKPTNAFGALRSQGFALPFASALPRASTWLDDALIFSAQKGDTRNIWRVPFRADRGGISGPAERLTHGTTQEVYPSSTAAGSVAFASLTKGTAIWSLPLDPNQAAVKGSLQRLTEGDTLEVSPSLSADGHVLVYGSSVPGAENVWRKDLRTGREVAIASTAAAEWHPVISRDGTSLAFTVDDPSAPGTYIASSSGETPRRVGKAFCWVFDWSPDKRSLLYHENGTDATLKQLNIATGAESEFLGKKGEALYQSRFSPDGEWLVLEAVPLLNSRTTSDSRVYVVKLQGGVPAADSEWILISDEHGWADKPRWSPDGNLLYYVSHRDGFRCIWAQRLEPKTKRPAGSPQPVFHSHSSRTSLMNVGLAVLEIDVARDKLVFVLGELTGNIWLLQSKARSLEP